MPYDGARHQGMLLLVNPSAVMAVRAAVPDAIVAGAFAPRHEEGVERVLALRSWKSFCNHPRMKQQAQGWFEETVVPLLPRGAHVEWFDTIAALVHEATATTEMSDDGVIR